jgi:acetyl esterase/lipase
MRSTFHYWLASLAICVGVAGFLPAVRAETPDHVLSVWPHEPPGDAMDVGPEQDMTKDADNLIAGRRIIKLGNVKTPQAHVYLPPENVRTGASVVICPGGGFNILAWDLEGTEVAQWLNTHGVAAVVLKYRVPTRSQNPRWLAPAQDAQRAVSLVRQHASEWKLDADQVAILGFSAGGMTAVKATLAPERLYEAVDESDKHPFKANRMILIYAAGLPNSGDGFTDGDDTIDANTPPVFMAHAFDDFVPVKGAAHLLLALKEAGVPSELHVYDAGGHGYGLRQRDDMPVTTWTEPCEAWLRRAGWIE